MPTTTKRAMDKNLFQEALDIKAAPTGIKAKHLAHSFMKKMYPLKKQKEILTP
jgi:hypothetical protein